MTDEEATEALQVAMTVGATRMQVTLSTERTKLGDQPESAAPAAPPPSFTAAKVVPQTGIG